MECESLLSPLTGTSQSQVLARNSQTETHEAIPTERKLTRSIISHDLPFSLMWISFVADLWPGLLPVPTSLFSHFQLPLSLDSYSPSIHPFCWEV